MAYPSEWTGSIVPYDTSGTAKFRIDSVEYSLRLDSFTSYQMLSGMLDVAFGQGKRSAVQEIRAHVNIALDAAERVMRVMAK